MTTRKNDTKVNELVSIFKTKLGWHKARITFFVSFLFALCELQTVCFVKLAQGFESNATADSNLRRIQRFFAGFVIENNLIAQLIFNLLPSKPPYRLCLDRTNWKFGKTNINILMLSIAFEGVSIPVFWTLLDKRGNSNCRERKDLLDRYIDLFGKESIESILADREFVGDIWLKELCDGQIPFYIRIRKNMHIQVPGKGRIPALNLLKHYPLYGCIYYPKQVLLGSQKVFIAGSKIRNSEGKIDYIFVVSLNQGDALLEYKDRWLIESMFKAFKTSGFNLEATHLSDLNRISKLIALVSVALLWAYLTGLYRHRNIKPIRIKKHGRKAYSFFKYGLVFIAHALLNNVDNEIEIIVKVLSCT